MLVTSLTANDIHQNPSKFIQLINDSWNNISLIDPSLIGNKNGQICRFRGMVQDMPNPVFYFSKYEVRNKINGQTEVRSGKFMDTIQCSENETMHLDASACEHGERRLYFMVPVPAVCEWAQNTSLSKETLGLSKPLETEDGSHSHTESKRSAEDMEVEVEDLQNKVQKRHCSQTSGDSSEPDKCKILNDPSAIGCLVVMYDVPEASVKLNDVLEVVGFLYSEPLPNEEDEFDDTYKPPSPLTPRLHCVTFKKITNFNPLIESVHSSSNPQVISQAESVRADLHLALSQLFFGDRLIADYLICHLISQIYHRDETEVILGKLSLNICLLPEKYLSKEFYNILCKLLPKVQYLPFSVEHLNQCQLLSQKNYTTGHLEAGVLQLSDNTHLIIDETKLNEGKLEDKGVRNVNALRSLIKRQKLDYDFIYYSLGFVTDIPVITLSQTKSILPFDVQLGVAPSDTWNSSVEESFEAVNKFLNGELLDKIRKYLSVAAHLPFNLPEEFQTIIQEDFVALRQSDSSFSGNDLHELLVLARFMTLSYCRTVLTREVWDEAKRMMTSRRARALRL